MTPGAVAWLVRKVTEAVMRVVQEAAVGCEEAAPEAGPLTLRPRALNRARGPPVLRRWRKKRRRRTWVCGGGSVVQRWCAGRVACERERGAGPLRGDGPPLGHEKKCVQAQQKKRAEGQGQGVHSSCCHPHPCAPVHTHATRRQGPALRTHHASNGLLYLCTIELLHPGEAGGHVHCQGGQVVAFFVIHSQQGGQASKVTHQGLRGQKPGVGLKAQQALPTLIVYGPRLFINHLGKTFQFTSRQGR
jgi:hypothetical protein